MSPPDPDSRHKWIHGLHWPALLQHALIYLHIGCKVSRMFTLGTVVYSRSEGLTLKMIYQELWRGMLTLTSISRLEVTRSSLPAPAFIQPSLVTSHPSRSLTGRPARRVWLWDTVSGSMVTYQPGGTRVVGPGLLTWSDTSQSIVVPVLRSTL